jgi:Family of unknown function (DUF5996)
MGADSAVWPHLPYSGWHQTAATLHLWTQIVGKVRLSLTPWVNHSWQVPLYVTARGLGTSPIPFGTEVAEVEFDFIDHRLLARTSRGDQRAFALEQQSVADFYSRAIDLLRQVGVAVSINDRPCELPDPVRFPDDRAHGSYDADAAHNFWRALVQIDRVLKVFRSGFLGKVSPVHFFWGSFDLAVTRFSGRKAPLHPGGIPGLPDSVTREAYSHEVSSAGFWPGSATFPIAAFYSYAYPEPEGFRSAPLAPGARWEATLGEFILPYDMVRTSADPQRVLLEFLATTYEAAATAGKWDRAALECDLGRPARVRPLS